MTEIHTVYKRKTHFMDSTDLDDYKLVTFCVLIKVTKISVVDVL